MDNCKEFFLDDIVKVSVHPAEGCNIPIPPFVQNITTMSGCTMSTPVLVLGTGTNEIQVQEGSVSAKGTPNELSAGVINTLEISALIEDIAEDVRDVYNNIGKKDYYVCLHTHEGKTYLCYTLPNTFSMNAPVTLGNGSNRQVSFSMKAKSEFIPISS